MKAKPTRHLWLRPPALALLLAAILLPGTSSSVKFWACPILNLNNTVTCICDLTHSLHCHTTNNATTAKGYEQMALGAIATRLRSLPSDNRVQVLELQLDGLSNLPDGSFEGTNLQGLVIARSRMTHLRPEALRGLSSSLLALAITSGALTTVPTAALSKMAQLAKVDFSGNNIGEINTDTFWPLDHLQEINLSGNGIHSAGVFQHNEALRKLILDRNKLSGARGLTITSPTPLHKDTPFPNLKQLSVAHNQYKDVFRSHFLPDMMSLERLSLASNRLVLLEAGSFSSCPNLQHLDLSYNRIPVLRDGAFRELGNLSVLDLSHNRLVAYRSPVTFAGLAALTMLALNDNYLRAIDEGLFAPLLSVHTIDLKDNMIGYIHHQAFAKSRSLRSLDLEDNPLVCDCKLREFAAWLHKVTSLPEQEKRLVTCTVPARLHGHSLIDVPSHTLTCSDDAIPLESLTRMEREEKQAALRHVQGNPVPNRFDAVDDSGLQLVNYNYDGISITLNWLVSPELLPVNCDAVFIFEGKDPQQLHLRNKIRASCDGQLSETISDDTVFGRPITVSIPQVLRQSKSYRLCLAVIHLRTLVLGCSEVLHLDPETSLLVANNQMEVTRRRHHQHSTSTEHEDPNLEIELETHYQEQIADELGADFSDDHRPETQDKGGRKKDKHDGDDHKREKQDDGQNKKDKIHHENEQHDRRAEKQNGSHKTKKHDENRRNEKHDDDRRSENQDGDQRNKNNDGTDIPGKQDDSVTTQRDHSDDELPSISFNMSTPTSVMVAWQFTPEQRLPVPCVISIVVLLHDQEVDRKMARCDEEEDPVVTFTGLNLKLPNYHICAKFDRYSDMIRHQQLQQRKRCIPLIPDTTEPRRLPTVIMIVAIVVVFLVFAILIAAFIFKMGKYLCRPAPKTVGLMQAYRGSTQYRVFYHQPSSEQPLVHSSA